MVTLLLNFCAFNGGSGVRLNQRFSSTIRGVPEGNVNASRHSRTLVSFRRIRIRLTRMTRTQVPNTRIVSNSRRTRIIGLLGWLVDRQHQFSRFTLNRFRCRSSTTQHGHYRGRSTVLSRFRVLTVTNNSISTSVGQPIRYHKSQHRRHNDLLRRYANRQRSRPQIFNRQSGRVKPRRALFQVVPTRWRFNTTPLLDITMRRQLRMKSRLTNLWHTLRFGTKQ